MAYEGTNHDRGSQKRPDFEVYDKTSNRVVMTDVMLTGCVKYDTNMVSAKRIGFAALEGEKLKLRTTGKWCREGNYEFVPLVVESGGRYGKQLVKFVDGHIEKLKNNKTIKSQRKYWYTRLAVCVQNGVHSFTNRRRQLHNHRLKQMEEGSD